MLARLARELPSDGWLYEPKWDGFRALAFRDGGEVDLRSRHDRALARYFPELVESLLALPERRFVVDGEIVVVGDEGFDFPALLNRIHPARSRVELLRAATPASFVIFDLLADGEEDLRGRPFAKRRRRLERLLRAARPPLHLTPMTEELSVAAGWLERFQGAGIDGVIAKPPELDYRPGERAMVKVKPERTADCVVAGFRWLTDRALPSSLLLGLYDDEAVLHHIGVATAFSEARRRELLEELSPLAVRLPGHPWQHGFLVGGGRVGRLKGAAGRWTPDMPQDWVPLAPVRVCEVAYDQLDRDRFRHPARFRRWRPDRDPRSCTFEQLAVEPAELTELLG
jgi:ATP-dependent DNA ligase